MRLKSCFLTVFLSIPLLSSCFVSDSARDESAYQDALSCVPALPTSEISIKDASGGEKFNFTHSTAGGILKDEQGQVMLKFNDTREKEDKSSKVCDASGRFIGLLRLPATETVLLEKEKGKRIYELILDKNDFFKLVDAQGQLLYQVELKNDEVLLLEPGQKLPLARVSIDKNNANLFSAENAILLKARRDLPRQALCCFAMRKLSPEHRNSIAYALLFMRL